MGTSDPAPEPRENKPVTISGVSKGGMPWCVTSEESVEVFTCSACGYPMCVKFLNPTPVSLEKDNFVLERNGTVKIDLNTITKALRRRHCNLCDWEGEYG